MTSEFQFCLDRFRSWNLSHSQLRNGVVAATAARDGHFSATLLT